MGRGGQEVQGLAELPEGGRGGQAVRGLAEPAHAVPGPAAAPRWEPQPLSYQELQSERSEVPVSRLLDETALGRPGKEDSGTGTRAGPTPRRSRGAGGDRSVSRPVPEQAAASCCGWGSPWCSAGRTPSRASTACG